MTLNPNSGAPPDKGAAPLASVPAPGDMADVDLCEPPRLLDDPQTAPELRRDLRNYAVASLPMAALAFDPLSAAQRFETSLEQLATAPTEGAATALGGPIEAIKQGVLAQSLATKLGAGAVALALTGAGIHQLSRGSSNANPHRDAPLATTATATAPVPAEVRPELSSPVRHPTGQVGEGDSTSRRTADRPTAMPRAQGRDADRTKQPAAPEQSERRPAPLEAQTGPGLRSPSGLPKQAKKRRHARPGPPKLARAREEAELIARARRHLSREPERSLQLLAEHRRRFARGHLRLEAEGLEILALFSNGRYEEARARGRRYLARNPRAPLAARIRASMK